MNSKILKLFKLQIDEKNNIFKTKSVKKMLFSILKYVFLVTVVTALLYVLLMKIFMLNFKINEELMSIVLLVTQIVVFLFALGNVINTLYLNKNNELLMSLPVTPNQIFISKMLVVYMEEVIINSVFTLPLFLSLGILGSFEWSFFVFMPFFLLIMPLLPIALACLVSIPAMYVLRFFKRHAVVSIVTILALIAGGVWLYSSLLSSIASSMDIANKLMATILSVNKSIATFGANNIPFFQFANGFMHIDQFYWVLVYIGASAVILLGAVLLVKPFFFNIAMKNLEQASAKVKVKELKPCSPFKSLLKKEFLTVFRNPGSVVNYLLFTLLMPFIVFVYDKLLLTMIVNEVGQAMINGSHLMIVAILAMLSNTMSANAISREGNNFYIMKTTPIDYYTQTLAKLSFNAIFTVGAVIVTGIVTCFYIKIPYVICTTIAVCFASIGHMLYCYDLDLRKPMLDWMDSSEMHKVSGNIGKSILVGFVIAFLMGIFVIALATSNIGIGAFVILIFLTFFYAVYRLYTLILRVSYRYDRIEM